MTFPCITSQIAVKASETGYYRVREGKNRTCIQLLEKEITAVEAGCPCGRPLAVPCRKEAARTQQYMS